MVAYIELGERVGCFDSSFAVMAAHAHSALTNKRFGETNVEEFYTWFVEYINMWDVRVCMGDFKNALFEIVAACRSRGLTVDVAAWNGWKTPGGKPRADSVAILFFNSLGIYAVNNGLDMFPRSRGGLLAEEAAGDDLAFDYKNKPGHLVDALLQINAGPKEKLLRFLVPCDAPQSARADFKALVQLKKWPVQLPFCVNQKGLAVGEEGTHFPLAASRPERKSDCEEVNGKKGVRKGGQEGGSTGHQKGSRKGAAVAEKGKRGDQKGAAREQQGYRLAICSGLVAAGQREQRPLGHDGIHRFRA